MVLKNYFRLIFVFILMICTVDLIALSPRLLIRLCPESSVSLEDLESSIELQVIRGENDKDFEAQINKLDLSSECHRILINGLVKDLPRLARHVGYEFLELKEKDLASACSTITAKEKDIPLTDDALPRINAETAGLLYDLERTAYFP